MNIIDTRKNQRLVEMTAAVKASCHRLLLLIYTFLLLPFYACSTGNREAALNEAVGVAGNEGISHLADEISLKNLADNIYTDMRDGQQYRTVKIGNLVWMGENLNFRADNSWCSEDDVLRCNQYGRLYDWNTARDACPNGWHLPSRIEWDDLVQATGGSTVAGRKLKSRTQWNGMDDFGFSALPGGYRDDQSSITHVDETGFWWSATESESGTAYYRAMNSTSANVVDRDTRHKGEGFSVRCVLDAVGSIADEEKRSLSNKADTPSIIAQHGQEITAQAQGEDIKYYTIVKGWNSPICKDFLENLNYFMGKGETPMACDMRIAPQFEKFRTLNWEDMPVEENEELLKNLIYDIDLNVNEPKSNKDRRWSDFYTNRLSVNKRPDTELTLSKAPVKIFKDGRQSYALRQNIVNWCVDGGRQLFILAENLRIDPESFTFSGGYNSGRGDLFYYDGKIINFQTEFLLIDPSDLHSKVKSATIRIYDIIEYDYTKPTKLSREEICVFTYE